MIRTPFKNATAVVSTMAIFALGLVAGTEKTSAQQLTVEDFSVMTQSTATDVDAMLLWLLTGSPATPTQTIGYDSTAAPTATGWTGTLNGNYLGQTLNLAYAGTNTTGIFSWNTTGTFGGSSVTGIGTTSISYPTLSAFDLALSDVLTYDGNTYAVNYNVPGSILSDGTIMFGSPGNEEVGSGTVTLNNQYVDNWYLRLSYYNRPSLVPAESDILILGGVVGNANNVFEPGAIPKPRGSITQTITVTVPEPNTITLLVLSVGLGAVQYFRKKMQAK